MHPDRTPLPRRSLLLDRRGVSAVEYVLLLCGILLLVAAGYRLLGTHNAQVAARATKTLQGGPGDPASPGGGLPPGGCPGGVGAGNAAGDPGSSLPPGSSDPSSGQPVASNDEGGGDRGGGDGNEGSGGEKNEGGGFWGGVGDFFKGAIQGDFGGDNGWSGIAGQVVTGFIPVVGQIADARDTIAGIKAVVNGEPGGWAQLGGAAVAWIPGVGDGLKAGIKGARHADEVADATAGVIAKNSDEAASQGAKVASKADAQRLIDESEGRQFGNNTGHARAHVPKEGEDAAKLAESRRNANGNPYQNNTVFRTGRHGEQALRDIMNERADDLAKLKPGDPPVQGTHTFQYTVEGMNSANGGPAQRVQIRAATYSIVRLPDGKLHLIHFAPRM
ncbi:hypothetical protein [Pendulispora albinea]|uniref:Bacterial CdiA-CT RNAse A domain-containing protein n=1 Tax=Pendulispora albinea TaxID=2741071 RepID=A0ABZ2MBW5_9BACT